MTAFPSQTCQFPEVFGLDIPAVTSPGAYTGGELLSQTNHLVERQRARIHRWHRCADQHRVRAATSIPNCKSRQSTSISNFASEDANRPPADDLRVGVIDRPARQRRTVAEEPVAPRKRQSRFSTGPPFDYAGLPAPDEISRPLEHRQNHELRGAHRFFEVLQKTCTLRSVEAGDG